QNRGPTFRQGDPWGKTGEKVRHLRSCTQDDAVHRRAEERLNGMGTESTASIITYLRALAPDFFAERMRGASDAEILRLEQAAGLRMSDSHREFLRAMGMTPARALNPFLND